MGQGTGITVTLVCFRIWKANPTGDGTALEMRRALIAPLEFDSLAFRQIRMPWVRILPLPPHNGNVAPMVEQRIENSCVTGSSPVVATTIVVLCPVPVPHRL